MSGTIGNVTALITRPKGEQRQLLLIQHPYAGIQIPAGTIEPGETPNEAALREAGAESPSRPASERAKRSGAGAMPAVLGVTCCNCLPIQG